MSKIDMITQLIFRNRYLRNGAKAKPHTVNLEYFNDSVNLGDALAPVIVDWMLEKKQLSRENYTKKTRHFMTVGSILGGRGFFDATVWGSGVRCANSIYNLGLRKRFQKLDIRAVRGPLTRQILLDLGYHCPDVFGDPGILMPLIYLPEKSREKNGKIGVVQHFLSREELPEYVESVDIQTTDYQGFIDKLLCYDKIIASSLHGIILAESYGVPAVFMAKGRDAEMIKYLDYYYATGRYSVKIAFSMEEAIAMEPMPLPDLKEMQERLLKAFPYDLWEK